MKYVCGICGYVYDETAQGAAFAELPEDWVCPLCGAPKSDFAPEAAPRAASAPADVRLDGDLVELGAGALSALMSNLARGCEKQYKPEAAALFAQLADYFAAAAPAQDAPSVEKLAAAVKDDLERGYPSVRATAVADGDRGAQRVCVWGEKVTRIQNALLARYEKEGEAFLEGKQVWVCSVCGFVYIGERPPELCPVCKVPEWKFDRIEGRHTA